MAAAEDGSNVDLAGEGSNIDLAGECANPSIPDPAEEDRSVRGVGVRGGAGGISGA